MKLYRLRCFRRFELHSFPVCTLDDHEYFYCLDDALAFVDRFADKSNVWSVELYDGFLPVKFVARSSY